MLFFLCFLMTACQKEVIDVQSTTSNVKLSKAGKEDYSRYEGSCSYPFKAEKVYKTNAITAHTPYKLYSHKNSDKKWTWRASASKNWKEFPPKITFTLTNKTSSYPLILRVVAVNSSWGSETYELIRGAYIVLGGNSKTITIVANNSLVAETSLSEIIFLDFEVIVKNRKEIGQNEENIPIEVGMRTSFYE